MAGLCRVLRWPWLLPLLIGLAALLTIGGCNTVESDVRGRVLSALQAQGLDGVDLEDVSYRNVRLRGPDDLESGATAAIEGLVATREVTYAGDGTRPAALDDGAAEAADVDEASSIGEAVAADAVASLDLEGVVDDGTITLAGAVPDEDTKAALVDAAEAAFGAANVEDELTVTGVGATAELSEVAGEVAGLMATFPDGLSDARFRLQDMRLSILGEAPTEGGATSVREAANDLTATAARVDLNVAGAPTVAVAGDITDGSIVLSGTVPDSQMRDALVFAAEDAFGAANVVDQLTMDGQPATDAQAAAMSDVASLVSLLPVTFDSGRLSIDDTVVSLRGTTTSLANLGELEEGLARLSAINVRTDLSGPAGEVAVVAITEVLERKTITFESGSAVITPEGNAVLEEILPVLAEAYATDPDLSIEIGGHTDSQGAESFNLELSAARAEAVRDYLVENNIPADGLVPVGYGETQPVADNAPPEGRAQNRRIEFTVLEG